MNLDCFTPAEHPGLATFPAPGPGTELGAQTPRGSCGTTAGHPRVWLPPAGGQSDQQAARPPALLVTGPLARTAGLSQSRIPGPPAPITRVLWPSPANVPLQGLFGNFQAGRQGALPSRPPAPRSQPLCTHRGVLTRPPPWLWMPAGGLPQGPPAPSCYQNWRCPLRTIPWPGGRGHSVTSVLCSVTNGGRGRADRAVGRGDPGVPG